MLSQRVTFKSILSADQLWELEVHYNLENKIPRRREKLELCKKLNIEPIILNKWFQAKRNKDKKEEKLESRINKSRD